MHRWLRGVFVAAGVVVLVYAGLVGYSYAQGYLNLPPLPFAVPMPFVSAPYDSAKLLEDIAAGAGRVNSSNFSVSLHAFIEPRDKDAVPFVPGTGDSGGSLLALQSAAASIPSDMDITLSLGGATEKTDTGYNGRLTLSGALKSSAFSAELALEARKVADNFYFNLRKFPSLFGNFTAVTNQWVLVTPEDQKNNNLNFGSTTGSVTSPEERQKQHDRLVTALRLADQDKVLLPVGTPSREVVAGVTLWRYTLALNPDTLLTYAQDLHAAEPDYTISQDTLDYLGSAEGKQELEYVARNVAVSIWARSDGIPAQFELSVRAVPGDSAVALKDKQLRVMVTLLLSDINTPAAIEVPTPTITFDEAYKLVFGTALVDSRIKSRDARRQSDIKTIQVGLEIYYNDHNSYPAALSALAPDYLPAVPVDPQTEAPYTYARTSASHYKLSATLEGAVNGSKLLNVSQ